MITLEVAGVRYQGFTSISVYRSIETISGSFNFVATSSQRVAFPIKVGSPCAVYIDNIRVANGYVDIVTVSYNAENHTINIQGRDKTADIVDSSMTGLKEFIGLGLVDIIRTVLNDNNMSDIKVINEAGALEPFDDDDPASSPVGQSIFEFLEQYARKRQVLLTTDGNGNVVLSRSGSQSAISGLQNKIGGQFNNILSAIANYDFSNRFNRYIINSDQSPGGFDDVEYEDAIDQSGEAIDDTIRASRISETIAEITSDDATLDELAIWTRNVSAGRSTEYECVVQGFYQDTAKTQLWKPNLLVKVDDDFADISATLLIKSVEYSVSLEQGSVTAISLVDKDTYTIQAKIDAATARANNQGDGFTF
jgi:prophage tail gpP-like protein